jgi:hypothetical protein
MLISKMSVYVNFYSQNQTLLLEDLAIYSPPVIYLFLINSMNYF